MKHKFSLIALSCLFAVLLTTASWAAGSEEYCFSEADFSAEQTLDGIFLSQVPNPDDAGVYLGSRQLRAGDVIPSELFAQLRLKGASDVAGEATVVFYPIAEGHIAQSTALKIPFGKQENKTPVAEDSTFETYKNIANTGTLSVTDPEGEPLTLNLVRKPNRGTVVLEEGGTFTYTPNENKVGRDSFVFTATDPAGNTSREATVSIQILKPMEKTTYADMNGQEGHFYAVWLREKGLFSGEEVAGHLCFNPEKEVTRGEFLAMTMKLLDAEAADAALSTGFADEKDTPTWLQPYLVNALKTGMIAGVASDDGMVFRPTAALTKAEAAVMLQNALNLPTDAESPVFRELSAVPVWAQSSYKALTCAGIEMNPALSAQSMTRLEAAELLCKVASFMNDSEKTLPWSE